MADLTTTTTTGPDAPGPDDRATGSPPWRTLYPVHPCAEVFPLLSEAKLAALADDIFANGLQSRIVLWRDPVTGVYYVLDGRNRLDALARLGVPIPPPSECLTVPPASVHFDVFMPQPLFSVTDEEDDLAAFVISANIRRRHLTKEEQAALILKAIAAEQRNDSAIMAESIRSDRADD